MNKNNNENDYENLLKLLNSDEWPEAIDKNLICNPNSEEDKTERADAIIQLLIEKDIKGLRFLDMGCGQGHIIKASAKYNPKFSIGYDIEKHQLWNDFKNVNLTTNFDEVRSNGPYDIILIYDVLDHIQVDSPVDFLKKVKSVLSESGKVYMRCHPYTSKHATHLYNVLNKAYVHLVFSNDELNSIAPQKDGSNNCLKITTPIKTYGQYIENAGFNIVSRADIKEGPPNFFRRRIVGNRIMKNVGMKTFPTFQMSLQFVDYVLN